MAAAPKIYNFYVFDRRGTCLLYEEWERPQTMLDDPDEDQKLMFGLLFSFHQLAKKLSPKP